MTRRIRNPNTGLSTSPRIWALAVFAVAYIAFCLFFFGGGWNPWLDASWLVAVLAWPAAFWRADTPTLPRLRHPYWFYALYVITLAPFATNWRWALTGDNLLWPIEGLKVAALGPDRSLLNVYGVDNFGYLQTNLHNIYMFLIAPTLFWHRVGKITVALLAMAAIYTVFARLVRPAFGLLVAGCSATCSVWIVYTYASVPFLDGLASGFALLAIGMWVHRDPESIRAWLALGWLSGFMLFLTPNGWLMAVCVWTGLTWLSVRERWNPRLLALAAITAVIVGTPMLIQWSYGHGRMFTLVEHPRWTPEKIASFLQQAAYMPFHSTVENSGAFGPQLPWGFRWLFVPAVLITPFLPRRYPGARLVLALLVVHVVLLAFTQGPYDAVSVKRALVLIPLAVYFVFVPFHRMLTRLPVVMILMSVWASFGIHDVVAEIYPTRTGYNFFDGAIEAHQRFAPATICVYMVDDLRAEELRSGSALDRLYGLTPRMQVVSDPNDPTCADVLCYCSQPHCGQVDLAAHGYVEVPMLNTIEMRCGRKGAVP